MKRSSARGSISFGAALSRSAGFAYTAIASLALFHLSCAERPRYYRSGVQERQIFRDDFEGDTLSQRWQPSHGPQLAKGAGIEMKNGRLVLKGRRNHPLWLRAPHPDNFRLEFEVWPQSHEMDVKFEVAGDGHSRATASQYRGSGYVLIFGGWNGTKHMIARRDEHGEQVVTREASGLDPQRRYHFKVIRRGAKLSWWVDGQHLLTYFDEEPLTGSQHRFFAFNNWNAEVHFDHLRLFALDDSS